MMKKLLLLFFAAMSITITFCNTPPKDNGIIAYPVPFNPSSQVLSISYPGGVTSPSLDTVNVSIFDINDDTVFHGDYNTTTLDFANPIIWNGRNSNGNFVKTGDYTIIIVMKNTKTGYYLSSLIKIFIQQ